MTQKKQRITNQMKTYLFTQKSIACNTWGIEPAADFRC